MKETESLPKLNPTFLVLIRLSCGTILFLAMLIPLKAVQELSGLLPEEGINRRLVAFLKVNEYFWFALNIIVFLIWLVRTTFLTFSSPVSASRKQLAKSEYDA